MSVTALNVAYEVLNGRVKLADAEGVQRATEDALWLQATLTDNAKGLLLDLGAGSGVVGLCAAARCSNLVSIDLLENNNETLKVLRHSVDLNILSQKIRVVSSSVYDLDVSDRSYDIVLSNPPYYLGTSGHKSYKVEKKEAHYITYNELRDWVLIALSQVKDHGILALILHIESYNAISDILRPYKRSIIRLQSSPTKDPKRILIYLEKCQGDLCEYTLKIYDKKIRDAVLKQGASLWDVV